MGRIGVRWIARRKVPPEVACHRRRTSSALCLRMASPERASAGCPLRMACACCPVFILLCPTNLWCGWHAADLAFCRYADTENHEPRSANAAVERAVVPSSHIEWPGMNDRLRLFGLAVAKPEWSDFVR